MRFPIGIPPPFPLKLWSTVLWQLCVSIKKVSEAFKNKRLRLLVGEEQAKRSLGGERPVL